MHPEAFAFVRDHLACYPVRGLDIVEVGSYDVNGSVRPLCVGARLYVGVDTRSGPGVDMVGSAAHLPPAWRAQWDVVICCEVLEHAHEAAAICAEAYRILRPDGRFIVTCATDPRPPHGIDGGAVGAEHYANVSPAALQAWCARFPVIDLTLQGADLYAVAWKLPKVPNA